ncbi:hypothetical protein E9993_21190 [Labilibacter sediminis]|nr:hypothetical protein E9993_21190 [Labilibacter sediminis]
MEKHTNNLKLKALWVLSVLLAVVFGFSSCDEMDDNYKDYIEHVVYSPRVTELSAVEGLKVITLNWQNPVGDIAQKIIVEYDDVVLPFDEMINTLVIEDLDIKGYEMRVYTEDAFGNRSVPATIFVFPNGGEED